MAHRNSLRLALPAALLALGAASVGCITETVSSTSGAATMRTEGVVVFAPLEETWTVVQDVVTSMASDAPSSAGVAHSLRATINGAPTTVLVDFKNTRETAVHVRTEDDRVAERIRSAVQFRLARR